jgi:hypothetical protein
MPGPSPFMSGPGFSCVAGYPGPFASQASFRVTCIIGSPLTKTPTRGVEAQARPGYVRCINPEIPYARLS